MGIVHEPTPLSTNIVTRRIRPGKPGLAGPAMVFYNCTWYDVENIRRVGDIGTANIELVIVILGHTSYEGCVRLMAIHYCRISGS
jgi:hypothetical protein